MHFSTIVLPFYLLAIAASSPIQEADAGNSVTRSDDSGLDAPANGKCTFRLSYLLANDSTVPIVHEVLVFTGSKNADIEDRFVPNVEESSVQENDLVRRVPGESTEFHPGRSYATRTAVAMVVHGVNVVVTSWFNDVHTVFVELAPAFPGAPNFVVAGFEDPEKTIRSSPTLKWTWDTARSFTAPRGHIYQFDDIFRLFWN